ncbi:MAG: heme-copper oxidase subunit III, partial [Phycisphaerales bacterium]
MSHAPADAHEHPDFLRHHFNTPKQQFEAGKLGMWLFLATEVLLFGGLFVGYSVWRGNHPEMFKAGSVFLNTNLGAVNTAVLILSSITMAAAVTMAQRNKRGPLILLLSLTMAGAVTFLVIKYFEY